jgi:membrane-associated HD superfamily phosphohydrolase
VARKESADHLDDELKYLADVDTGRQYEGYALVRIIVWATPMLGFLGTVIGITLALGDLSPEALVNSPEQAMQGLLAGLSVAFDTTALALSLSIVLMFGQFLTNQLEADLLTAVERRANSELVGRFIEYGSRTDPQLASVRRMTETVLDTARELVESQTQLWHETIRTTHEQLQEAADGAHRALQSGMRAALTEAAQAHAAELSRSEQSVRRQTEQSQQLLLDALARNARVLQQQQTELTKQGDMLLQLVQGAGEIGKLEETLHQNLRTVASARSLESTLERLAAAVERMERQPRNLDSLLLDTSLASAHSPEERAA